MLPSFFSVLMNFTESNFQLSAMLEASAEADGVSSITSDTTLGSSITACKKVLCSNSLLDSSEYWLRNNKVLCRVSLLEEDFDGSCTTICFVNLDQTKVSQHDDGRVKKLASVSPDLPKLIGSLSVRLPKENEILLLSGLEAPDSCHPDPSQTRRGADVCLVQCAGGPRPIEADSIIFEINKFLIGLQWGQDKQPMGRGAGPRLDDDTNRSISSIEDDFLTASEHLGDDSEDDGFKNEPESREVAGSRAETAHRGRPAGQKARLDERQDSEESEATICAPAKKRGAHPCSRYTKESAGHYATNLAESVLQDAFIRLSQDEPSFVPEVARSMSLNSHPIPFPHPQACPFELPKIVIVQSPDNAEGSPEWPGPQASHLPADQAGPPQAGPPQAGPPQAGPPQVGPPQAGPPQAGPPQAGPPQAGPPQAGTAEPHRKRGRSGHTSKPLEVALACAASVIGIITSPQATEQLTLEPEEEDPGGEGEEDPGGEREEDPNGTDYSFSSAMCGMAQVAGAIAVVDLTEESGEGCESDESSEAYSASRGLMNAAQASTAVPLHCSVAEGSSIESFRANIAEVLHKEAAEVLAQPQGYRSLAHLLETTHNKIVDGITCPKKSYVEETEVDDFITEVADSLFKHALEKAKKKKELEAPGKDVPNLQGFLQERVNSLLFDVLCLASKKIGDISKCNLGSVDSQEGDACFRSNKERRDPFSQLQQFTGSQQPDHNSNLTGMFHHTEKLPKCSGEVKYGSDEKEREGEPPGSQSSPLHIIELHRHGPTKAPSAKDFCEVQCRGMVREPLSEVCVLSTERRARPGNDSRQSSLTPQSSLSSCQGALLSLRMDSESRTPVTCFADDLATTVVSMATELAAIYLENSSGKQPWFCALKGASGEGAEAYLLPCRSALRRKEGQNGGVASKKHRPPRLSEIKRKTEEQPELMERLVNQVVDETVHPDDPLDPFALFASEVTARIMNCPELSVVDTSKPGQPRCRLPCERWSRGKPASYESIPEEDADPSGAPNTLGPGSRLGQNLSRGSSISKQSSCESITDEFSRFMVNQMETEGRGFDLLLDYYAGKNASSILSAAVQQAATKKNGHLNVRAPSCLSKQSSTESITEEFYRFMLRDMDKENKDYRIAKTKEWSNSLQPPSLRTPFCIRQSSVPDRRSSDSRLTVNSPVKANSFDGFARNVRGDTLNIYPANSASASGLCKSDSCLYQRGHTDQITDMLIHDTWSSSIESLMRKNKIIADPEDSIDLDGAGDHPHVQQHASRLAADIMEAGRSALGGQQEAGGVTTDRKQHMPVGEKRRGFKQSRPSCSRSRASQEQAGGGVGDVSTPPARGTREVPLIHIEGDQRDELHRDPGRADNHPRDLAPHVTCQRRADRGLASLSSSERDRAAGDAAGERNKRSLSASSEESTGSWSHIAPDDDPHEENSSFIQLSEGNGNSSASSLGLGDLETFPDMPNQSSLGSEEAEKAQLSETKENVDEGISVRTVRASCSQRELLVVNWELNPECVDPELRLVLQWIAASELGLQALYFRWSREMITAKFQRVLQHVSRKAWRIADLFGAVVQFCQLPQEDNTGEALSSLFDWLLENH
ncbi:A-kinase anchor protein SPHKAP isoform X3 [Osmerus eperlanus]|uniref:A-kinase anchor protein SPHKAP isoform X3 n=1 Tax=Osmerus eperlanus TaxID=29151 RepID=UPI002E14F90F